jgi:hypothetical protein
MFMMSSIRLGCVQHPFEHKLHTTDNADALVGVQALGLFKLVIKPLNAGIYAETAL